MNAKELYLMSLEIVWSFIRKKMIIRKLERVKYELHFIDMQRNQGYAEERYFQQLQAELRSELNELK